MKTSTNSTESKTDSTQSPDPKSSTGYVDPSKVAPPPAEPEDTTDDFGYEKEPEKKIAPPPATPAAPAPKTEEKPPVEEKKLSGYGKDEEPPKTEEKPPVEEKKPEEMTDEEKAQKEIADSVAALGDGYDKEKIKKFAIENKFTKAQLDAYVKLTKEEEAQIVKQAEEAKRNQRKAWKEELLKDPDFGGENFDLNVDRVEKVLQNYMPNIKKVLTEKGSMLPPYIMKDFLSLAKVLNPTNKLDVGEPPAPKEEEGDYLSDLYS
jgi:hypothetical protein